MYSERLLDYFRNPKYAGILQAPARVVHLENPACGDILRLTALVEDGVVRQAAFQVRGCTASIACGAALAEWLQGRSLDDVRLADVAGIVEGLVGGLAAESKHAAKLMADAARRLGEGG
ncbi:MAG TPA: iron-sulfur cluster assembly scaffold protein [Paludibaculum sp.]